MRRSTWLGLIALAVIACGKDEKKQCNPTAQSGCATGKVCEAVENGGAPACFDPVVVKGKVFDLATQGAIAGARLVALDPNRAPVSLVATSAQNGTYALDVRAERKSDGTPVAGAVTLRADAATYQSFPGGVRVALPLDLSVAVHGTSGWTLQSSLTDVGLIKDAGAGTAALHGNAAVPSDRGGVLVVAETGSPANGATAIADRTGAYAIFNLAPGTYTVTAYAHGENYAPATATLQAGQDLAVDLAIANATTATVDGGLIFNSGATTPTSVALVLKSTYQAALDRGESPPGLVAAVPSGSTYSFTGVPDGSYIALAAFGIDGDVRDLSGGGNTAPVGVEVQGGSVVGGSTLGQFKLVGAIALTTIDGVAVDGSGSAVKLTSATPAFTWVKDSSYSSAASYTLDVFDAFGNDIFTAPKAAGNSMTVTYAGAALTSGMYYQLRIRALDGSGNQLSQTEDLKGVFYLP